MDKDELKAVLRAAVKDVVHQTVVESLTTVVEEEEPQEELTEAEFDAALAEILEGASNAGEFEGDDDTVEESLREIMEDASDDIIEESIDVVGLKNGKKIQLGITSMKALNQVVKTADYDGFIVTQDGQTTEFAVSNKRLVEV